MSVDYIDKIVESRDNDKMYELGCIVRDMMEYIEMEDAEEYAKIDRKMYEIVNGKVLTAEKAEHIIKHMSPDGMKWTMTQTEEVRNQYGIGNVRDVDANKLALIPITKSVTIISIVIINSFFFKFILSFR